MSSNCPLNGGFSELLKALQKLDPNAKIKEVVMYDKKETEDGVVRSPRTVWREGE